MQLPAFIVGGAVERNIKFVAPNQLGRNFEQDLTFANAFPDQAKLAALQVAQAAMNKLAGFAGSASRPIAFFQ